MTRSPSRRKSSAAPPTHPTPPTRFASTYARSATSLLTLTLTLTLTRTPNLNPDPDPDQVRELLRKLGYVSADGDAVVLAGGIVSDELGRLAQSYTVTEVELGEPTPRTLTRSLIPTLSLA